MPNPTRAEVIKRLLEKRTHPDLAALYDAGFEVQVNVARGDGQLKDGYSGKTKQVYTDGINTWFAFRCPENAWNDPVDNSGKEVTYDLFEHADHIGLTGWNFAQRRSHWFAYDFDSIVGHSEKHVKKLTDEELGRVRDKACAVPWVTVRRSTGGSGLHLYVFLKDPEPTKNHTEHAALGRAILSQLSAIAGYDFVSKVDVCGGNIWVWARRMKGTQGLTLIKQGEPLGDVPPNWRQHLKVTKGERKKTLPEFAEGHEANFDELAGQLPRVQLDDDHKKLIEWLQTNQGWGWWDADHHMLVTHTYHLKRAHEALALKGVFETASEGTDLETQNCFSGDTEVLTPQGPRTLRELAQVGHAKLLVQTERGLTWIDSPIKCFGKQVTYPVIFGDRNQVRATRDHAWLYYDSNRRKVDLHKRKYTFELNDKVVLPQADIALPEPDMEGYAHGFTFGDGWLVDDKHCDVAFFKEDEALLSIVAQHGSLGEQRFGDHHVHVVRGLPKNWKSLPAVTCTKEYAFGFLLGLISADGFVNNQIQVQQSDLGVMEEVRRLAQWVGMRVNKMREVAPSGFANAQAAWKLTFSSYNFKPEHFLREDHKRKLKVRQKSIGTTAHVVWSMPKHEDVYCAQVEKHHNFVLANGVITGNCFLFPMRSGAWSVRRYTPGVAEVATWEQDGKGWTKCYFNRDPDLRSAARAHGGVETAQGSFAFQETAVAAEAVQMLGGDLKVPAIVAGRPAKVSPHKDGKRVVVEVAHGDHDDAKAMEGWYLEKNKWRIVVQAPYVMAATEGEVGVCDELVRKVSTESRADAGWFVRVDDHWNHEPKAHVALALLSTGRKKAEVDQLMGASVLKPWVIVNRPFSEEYPGDRLWNRSKAQFRYPRSEEVGDFPTWNKLFDHLGEGLNDALATNGWALANDVRAGSTYLKFWLASILKDPYAPLPYLFFCGPQNCGKSSFHEAADLLISGGIVEANTIFEKDEKFNSALEGAVMCVVEEMNLQKNKKAYERIKNWVTSRKLTIRKMYLDAYEIDNTTHWCHFANDWEACPIFPGDTRITLISVSALTSSQMIPKSELLELLKREAPHFLNHLLSLEVPPSNDRLRVPVVATSEKEHLQKSNRNALEVFLEEHTHHVPGEMVLFAEFYEKFQQTLEAIEAQDWGKKSIGSKMPPHFPIGKKGGEAHIGNLSWHPAPPGEAPKPRLIINDKKILVPVTTKCGTPNCVLNAHDGKHVRADGVQF